MAGGLALGALAVTAAALLLGQRLPSGGFAADACERLQAVGERVVGQEPYERIPAMPWGHLIVEPGRSVRFQEVGFIGSGDTLRLELDYTHTTLQGSPKLMIMNHLI